MNCKEIIEQIEQLKRQLNLQSAVECQEFQGKVVKFNWVKEFGEKGPEFCTGVVKDFYQIASKFELIITEVRRGEDSKCGTFQVCPSKIIEVIS